MLRVRAAYGGIAVLAMACAIGCGGGGGTPSAPLPATPIAEPTTAIAASTSAPLSTTTAASMSVAAGGVTSNVMVPATSSGSGTLTVVAATTSPATVPLGFRRPASVGNTFEFLTITTTNTVTFASTPSFTITLPSSISTSGQQFFLAELSPSASSWVEPFLGPASVNGQVLTFASANQQVTLQSGAAYVFALYSVAQIIASPTPSASASPTVAPSATASPTQAPSTAPTASPAPSQSPTVARATTLFVGNSVGGSGNFVDRFPATASGAPVPSAALQLPNASRPNFLFADNQNRVWVSQAGEGSVTAYDAPTLSNILVTLTGFTSPAGVYLESDGTMYVADNGANVVDVFAPGSNGAAVPTKTYPVNAPQGIWEDSQGRLYVATGNAIDVFAANAPSGASPSTIANAVPDGSAIGVTVDSHNNLWVAGGNATVAEFMPGATTPSITITSSALSQPWGVAVDAAGYVYVGDNTNGNVVVFAPGASGNVTNPQVLSAYGFNCPMGIAVR